MSIADSLDSPPRSPQPARPSRLRRSGSRKRPQPHLRSQRGNALLVSLIALTGLAALGNLTVATVQGNSTATANDRFHSIALYAAESGGAAAIDYLRDSVNSSTRFTTMVTPSNNAPKSPAGILGNGIQPGATGNAFSPSLKAWYSVQLLNNREDPGYATGSDEDASLIIRATGYGPGGATAILEWKVQATGMSAVGRPCPGYGQKGLSEDGSGRNDCMGAINLGDTATYRPGGSS
jgi:hypothetical protein